MRPFCFNQPRSDRQLKLALPAFGVMTPEALFSDGERAKFRVLSRDQCCAVRLVHGPSSGAPYELAVEDWLSRNA